MSARLVSPTAVKHFFLQCPGLERASRSLAKTGFLALGVNMWIVVCLQYLDVGTLANCMKL